MVAHNPSIPISNSSFLIRVSAENFKTSAENFSFYFQLVIGL